MGRKRSRTGQLVCFCLAQLIVITIVGSLSGCAWFRGNREAEPANAAQSLQRGRRLLAQQDYEGAVRENQRALALSHNKPPADEAIFNLGLVSAHTGNPKKDNRAAVGYFNRVIKEYPQSQWADQAKIWIGVLQQNDKLTETLEKSKQVDIEIEEKRRQK
jgi:TolA-binding protein